MPENLSAGVLLKASSWSVMLKEKAIKPMLETKLVTSEDLNPQETSEWLEALDGSWRRVGWARRLPARAPVRPRRSLRCSDSQRAEDALCQHHSRG